MLLPLLLLTACAQQNDNKPQNSEPEKYDASATTASTHKAPDFTLKNTSTGADVKLSDYRGKVVIIDFWATWCPPCRRGIPDLVDLKNRYGDDIEIIGISVDNEKTVGDIPGFIKEKGINYPVVYYNNEVVNAYGGISSIPTSFIIDKEGNITASYVGLVDKEVYETAINKLKVL